MTSTYDDIEAVTRLLEEVSETIQLLWFYLNEFWVFFEFKFKVNSEYHDLGTFELNEHVIVELFYEWQFQ